MKLHFEANLGYQLDAVDSVVRLFESAPRMKARDTVFAEVHANILKLSPDRIFQNRDTIVSERKIAEKDAHKTPELDFSVEMETGTGKTYVYLRTIFDLHRAYGLSKFIIVVPSIPVREGVLKTLEITRSHFKELYSVPFEFFGYESKKLAQVKAFCESNTLQIMIMNIQSFNAEDRIISQERDATHGVKLIDLIKQTYPVIVMDEPQVGMGTAKSEKALASLNPLFKIRYSATHETPKNVVYRLTPFDAYNQNLVKKIEVFSVQTEGAVESLGFKDAVFAGTKPPQAKLTANVRLAENGYKTKTITCKTGDSIEEKTGNIAYRGLIVERIWRDINDERTKLQFTNGTVLMMGEQTGRDSDEVFREQIRWTIKKHFEKKAVRNPQGIKVLSLFFIDRVANYMNADGKIRKLFLELYREIYKEQFKKEPTNIDAVHNGYFAKTGNGEWTDSEASMSKNSDAYQLILKDKERLLSQDEPLEFIFSHSALGVGWDNPNVFNICTLNETESATKKRQEIGRGLRICVNQDGDRVRDVIDVKEGKEVNLLTVIANQSYQAFAQSYQDELKEEFGVDAPTAKTRDARKKPTKLKLNKARFESKDFSELWKRIAQKTDWSVSFLESDVIDRCTEVVRAIHVPDPSINVELNRITTLGREDAPQLWNVYGGAERSAARGIKASLDPVNEISDQTGLAIDTIQKILEKSGKPEQVTRNPIAFMAEACEKIKRVINRELVTVVRYQKTGESYAPGLFEALDDTLGEVVATPNHGLYDAEKTDSDIERKFGVELDNDQHIRLFFKLPKWYSVPTPIGDHHPDWAIVVEKKMLDGNGAEVTYQFVVETKGTKRKEDLAPDERMKIDCAIKHFEAVGLKEYLAPIDTFETFKTRANASTNTHIL
jgi:type III restriction enzyme